MCDVRLDGNSNPCWITGITTTEGGKLIIVDRSNFNVKLFTHDFKNKSCLLIHDHPADICNFKEHECAVTATSRTVRIIAHQNDVLALIRVIELDKVSFVSGLKSRDSDLFGVVDQDQVRTVTMLDAHGKTYWSTSADKRSGRYGTP